MDLGKFWQKMRPGRSEETCGQGDVIAFLSSPGAYADAPQDVERISTHGAIIFLAGDHAYKMKRAVRLAYLDFSTLEKRRAALESEFRLNRAAAPEIYRRVMAVKRLTGGQLTIGDPGPGDEVIEWLLEMHRFDQQCLLDNLAAQGRIDLALAENLAAIIYDFHKHAQSTPRAPWPDSLMRVAGTVRTAFGDAVFAHLDLSTSMSALDERLDRGRPLMDERRRTGFVRRCHGDLHLRNIVMVNGQPRLFDALEFDEDLARIDVLYDLAFLLMDLWFRGLRGEANAVLNHYAAMAQRQQELAGLRLLPLFMAIRAGVRAMVGVDELGVAPPDRIRAIEDRTRDYAGLFKSLIEPGSPRFVLIGGLSGTGKTTVSRALAPFLGAAPGAIHLRSDVERKMLFGAGLDQSLPKDCYTGSASSMVYHRVTQKARAILDAGYSVIIDATFREPGQREEAAALAAQCGVPLEALWLQADSQQLIGRVTERRGDVSDADAAIVRQQLEMDRAACPDGWREIDARGEPAETVRRAAQGLGLALR